MEANNPKWVLLILAVMATALSLNDVRAEEVAYQLTESIEQLGDIAPSPDTKVDEPLLVFSLRESVRTPRSFECRGVVRIPFEIDLYQDIVRHVEKPTLPMQRLVKRYGICPPEQLLDPRGQLTESKLFTASPMPKRIDQAMRDAFYCLVPDMPRISDAIDACFPEPNQPASDKYAGLQLAEIRDCFDAGDEKFPMTPIEGLLSRSERENGLTSEPGSAPIKLDRYFPPPLAPSLRWLLASAGSGNGRIIVPAHGPAPIQLDFAFPPVWDRKNDRRLDAPTLRAPLQPLKHHRDIGRLRA